MRIHDNVTIIEPAGAVAYLEWYAKNGAPYHDQVELETNPRDGLVHWYRLIDRQYDFGTLEV